MKDNALLAKYRIEEDEQTKKRFEPLGLCSEQYLIPIDGNECKVIITREFGCEHFSASIRITESVIRVPNYDECLKIKEVLFEENETIVFGITRNRLMNMTVTNPNTMHMHKYHGPMPPIEKIMEINNYKIDGDYKITKGKGWGWQFVRIIGDHYPDMNEIHSIKNKYASDRDVAVFLLKDAVILFSNPKNGISFYLHTMK